MKNLPTTAKVKAMVALLALCALVVFALTVNTYAATIPPEVLAEIEANYPEGLPRYTTPEEQQWMNEQAALGILEVEPLALTSPPTGNIWTPGEYEQLDGVLIAWEGGYPSLLTQFAVEVSQSDTNATVYVIVDDTTEQSTVTSTLTSAGANMSNVEFIVRTTNSVWIRDWGPRHFYEDSNRAIMDHTNNSSARPDDNAFPSWLATEWPDAYYDHALTHGGGNFHVISDGNAFMSTLILEENSENEAEIIQIFKDYHNVNLTIYTKLPSTIDATGHIDMWMMPLSDTDILISEFPDGSTGDELTAKNLTDAAAANLTSRGYTIWRIPADRNSRAHYTYTNAAVVNNKVFVPQYASGDATFADEDAEALAVFEAAMPDHEIIPTDCYSIISRSEEHTSELQSR